MGVAVDNVTTFVLVIPSGRKVLVELGRPQFIGARTTDARCQAHLVEDVASPHGVCGLLLQASREPDAVGLRHLRVRVRR